MKCRQGIMEKVCFNVSLLSRQIKINDSGLNIIYFQSKLLLLKSN